MAEKFTLSLPAEEIDARLNRIPPSWTSIIDQTFNANSERGQSGSAIADYVTDSVNSQVSQLENSINNQVATIQQGLNTLDNKLENFDYNELKNKPFYSEFNYKEAQTLMSPTEITFEIDPDTNIGTAILAAPPDLPIFVGNSVELVIDEDIIQDTLEYAASPEEAVFSIGNIGLADGVCDPAVDKPYLMAYIPQDNTTMIVLYGITEPKHTISMSYTTTTLSILEGSYEMLEEEDSEGNPVRLMARAVGSLELTDLFNLTFNGNTFTEISFSTIEDITTDPNLINNYSGIYFIGNPSLVLSTLPGTSDDFFIYVVPGSNILYFFTTVPSASQNISFEKILQESEYIYKLDDKFLAYSETYSGNVIFNKDILINDGDISVKDSLASLKKGLDSNSGLLVAGVGNSYSYSSGLSANKLATPTNSYAWIEGHGAPGKSIFSNQYQNGYSSFSFSPSRAVMQKGSSCPVIKLSYPSAYNADAVYTELQTYCYAKGVLGPEIKTNAVFETFIRSKTLSGTDILLECSSLSNLLLDNAGGVDVSVTSLIAYPEVGYASHSEGDSIATGNYSHAEGNRTEATGSDSHAEGNFTEATGNYSHAEGGSTVASSAGSHAEGYSTEATGEYSHAEGYNTIASGFASHAEGNDNKATGYASHAEGYYNEASQKGSHVEGYFNKATAQYSHAEGSDNEASGDSSHVEGYDNKATGNYSHAEGRMSSATGEGSHAEGTSTAKEKYSHAEGASTASGEYSHAEGDRTKASGYGSHAEGGTTEATGVSSHAEGDNTEASGEYSHAEGYGTEASGASSHAEGYNTVASGHSSHAEGHFTKATGNYSHAEGEYTKATGKYSHAEGYYTTATGDSAHVEGKYNIVDSEKQYAHILGNGTYQKLSNAHTIDWHGNAWFAGSISAGSYINETSGEPLGISTSNGIVLNDTETELAYVLQIKNGQLSASLLPEEIIISKLPDKLTYIAGEYIDLSGIEFTAYYPDGSTSLIEPSSVSYEPNPLLVEGEELINVKIRFYNVYEDSFSVVVNPFDPSTTLVDFTYEVGTDGTYLLTGWNQTLDGVPSTELIIPNNALIKL